MQVDEGSLAAHQDMPTDMGTRVAQHDVESIDVNGLSRRRDPPLSVIVGAGRKGGRLEGVSV